MKTLLARSLGSLIGTTLFLAALWVLHQALTEYRYQDIATYLKRLPRQQLALALLYTALSYLVTTGYGLADATLHPANNDYTQYRMSLCLNYRECCA